MDLRWNFEFGVRVSMPLPDGTALDPERMLLETLAEEFGLSPDDFGREFRTGRERCPSLASTRVDPNTPYRPRVSRTGRATASLPRPLRCFDRLR